MFPLIATQEVFYLNQEMYEAHDALRCIGEKNFIDDKNRFKLANQHYLKKDKDLAELYKDIPEALENNYNFHLRFNFKPKNLNLFYHQSRNSNSNSPENELLRQAKSGLENRLENFILKKNQLNLNEIK